MDGYRNEQWRLFNKDNYNKDKEKIYISNYGRVKKEIDTDTFKPLTIGTINKFSTFAYPRIGNPKPANFYVHRAVAFLFLERPEGARFVIHLNHDLKDNYYKNLKWVNQKELTAHQLTNPKRIEKFGIKPSAKLTENRVRLLKKKLSDPDRKTRLKIIAKQFGVSTTQLKRIKRGENWKEVKPLD
jgi:hypothetical protein